MTTINNIKKFKKDESGVTLVELLAGIAILSIVVTAFLAFFIQAANTNKQTDEVNEATFLAQERMEELTFYSANKSLADIKDDKDETFNSSGLMTLTEPKNDNGLIRVTSLTKSKKDDDTSNLYTAIVSVYEGEIERGKLRAQMETRLPFE